jgi:regulator of protease activity HflC (stomatin/prohibitin superfamily)
VNKNRTIGIAVSALIVLVLVLYNTTYTVNFHEIAVVTRFGKPAGVVREAGLHFKAPFFIDQVTRLDTRQQLIESPLETVLTRDGQQVLVQAYMTWRIDTDPDAALRFFTSYSSLEGASASLETQLQGALRSIGGYRFGDLVGQGGKIAEAEAAILEDLRSTRLAGTMPVGVGISQVVLPNKTTTAVLRRMSAVQETLANLEEAKGASAAEAIRSQAKSQADIIMNFADQWAARIEAKGNEEATRYYQEMRSESELAIFLAWLDTLKASLSENTTFVTDTTRAPFHLVDLDAPVDAKGIPQPGASKPKGK